MSSKERLPWIGYVRYFLIALPISLIASPTFRLAWPIMSCVLPADSSTTPSSRRSGSSVRSPTACLILPFKAWALPSSSSRFMSTSTGTNDNGRVADRGSGYAPDPSNHRSPATRYEMHEEKNHRDDEEDP